MSYEKWFNEMLDKYKDDIDFLTEEAIIDFNEKIVKRLKDLNMSRVELANKLGVSKAFVTKLLNGNPNLTIKTMISIVKALDCKLELDLCPKEYEIRKVYLLNNKKIDYDNYNTNVNVKIPGEIDAGVA